MGALKAAKHMRAGGVAAQVAALPYRLGDRLEVLLITSRDTGRWIIPKGWPMKGKAPHEAAAREALEEAGVIGHISTREIGVYHYAKRFDDGVAVDCVVRVFPLFVEAQAAAWREQGERVGRWFSVGEAVQAVQEPTLAALIGAFSPATLSRA